MTSTSAVYPARRAVSPQRLWQLRVGLFSLVISLTVGTPIALIVFNSPVGYLLEVGVFICLLASPLISPYFLVRRMMPAGLFVSLCACLLLMFFLVGMANGASAAEAYRDYRQILLFFVGMAFIYTLQEGTAVYLYLTTALLTAIQWVIILFLHVSVPGVSYIGKITVPVITFGLASIIGATYGSYVSVVIIVLLWLCCLFISYRYIYIASVMFTLGSLIIFGMRRAGVRARLSLATVAGTIILLLPIIMGSVDMVRAVDGFGQFASQHGMPSIMSDQLFGKTRSFLVGATGRGDLTYLYYGKNFLNPTIFALPHGLGHDHFVGDQALDSEGNSVDNGFIFLDFHFGILATYGCIAFCVFWLGSKCARMGVSDLPIAAIFVIPVVFGFYSRALPIINPFVSMTFGAGLAVMSIIFDSLAGRVTGQNAQTSTLRG